MIQRAAQRMRRLIDDLLDTSSIQLERAPLDINVIGVETLVHDVLEGHQTLAQEKGVKLVGSSHFEGVGVACDTERVHRVFGNLIGNSLKFCRDAWLARTPAVLPLVEQRPAPEPPVEQDGSLAEPSVISCARGAATSMKVFH